MELSTKIAESGLPKVTRDLIEKQFAGRIVESKVIDEAIEDQRKALTELSETGEVILPPSTQIKVGALTEWDKYELGFLRLLAGSTKFGQIVAMAKENQGKSAEEIDHFAPQRFSEAIGRYIEEGAGSYQQSVRLSEWFYQLMGGVDAAIDGRLENKRLIEAAVTTSSLSSIVKNTVNLMLAADYSVRHRWWDPIVRQEDVDTLDDSTLVRVYGIGGLNAMAEGDTYQELSWADEEETASYFKRGGYIGVTLETFLRDKINILRTIPSRLSNAWYNEISRLVAAVFTVNSNVGPALADTGALFNASAVSGAGGHANLLTTGMSYAEYLVVKLAMRKQTDQVLGAGKRLNIMPKYILVPADLEPIAQQVAQSDLVPTQSGAATTGGEFQTKNIVKGEFETVVVPEWTDINDWAAVADPAQFPAIWLTWLRGRRTPELFSASDERSGAMFTNDTLRYKVRMFGFRFSSTYDCAPVSDFRPLHKSNV